MTKCRNSMSGEHRLVEQVGKNKGKHICTFCGHHLQPDAFIEECKKAQLEVDAGDIQPYVRRTKKDEMTKITSTDLMDKALKITGLAVKHSVDDIGELAAELYQEIGQYVYATEPVTYNDVLKLLKDHQY